MEPTLSWIADWMPRQRWYSGKHGSPRLRGVAHLSLGADAEVELSITLVLDEADPRMPVYQVPVAIRRDLPDGAQRHVIATTGSGGYVLDGAADPAFARALLESVGAGMSRGVATTRVLAVEQSNTSIMADRGDESLLVKLFRVVHHGANPDVVISRTLSEAGVPFVPHFHGALEAAWADASGRIASGHLVAVQEFIPDAEDAWATAVRAASAGDDLAVVARELGVATAVMHRALADRMPTRVPTPGDVEAARQMWRARLEAAVAEVPALAEHREAIDGRFDRAAESAWPPLQRIHGDLHLGQAIRGASGGRWVFVDFEGEPLRSLAERSELEPPLRDVAGMLRSFHYAASGISDDAARRRWLDGCRSAFLAGYAAAAARNPLADRALLEAYELDKALYEVVYEARNRPDWVRIPLRAIEGLVAASATSA